MRMRSCASTVMKPVGMRLHHPHGAAHLVAGILIEHRVEQPFRKRRPGRCGQLMRDHRQMPHRRMRPQCFDETAIAGAEAVEAGKLGLLGQKPFRQPLHTRRVVAPFDKGQNPDFGIFALDHCSNPADARDGRGHSANRR